MKVKIGIVVCGLSENRQFVSNYYIQSIKYAGGLPLLLPLVRSDSAIMDYVSLCDGFLFCGGDDITPLLFGEEPSPLLGQTHITLDIFQIRLMKKVLEMKKPVLAICRGIQILNVACGGTICQDLALQNGKIINHMQHSAREECSHRVSVKSSTILRGITGPFLYTNSFHHQSIGTLGKNLVVSARTSDNVIEAVEMQGTPFVLGVQWHPECMYRKSPEMRTLFHTLIETSKKDSI